MRANTATADHLRRGSGAKRMALAVSGALSAICAPLAMAQSTAPPVPAQAAGIPLWTNLSYGMTGEQVTAALNATPGIKHAYLIKKNGKFARVKVTYTKEGITILGAWFDLDLTFDQELLTQVQLTSKDCITTVKQKINGYVSLLNSKYGNPNMQTEVYPSHEFAGYRLTYKDNLTRIILRLHNQVPPPENVPQQANNKIGRVAGLLDALASSSSSNECPEDQGVLGVVEITYRSDAEVRAEELRAQAEEQKAKADASGKL